jgi:hypothetical protein
VGNVGLVVAVRDCQGDGNELVELAGQPLRASNRFSKLLAKTPSLNVRAKEGDEVVDSFKFTLVPGSVKTSPFNDHVGGVTPGQTSPKRPYGWSGDESSRQVFARLITPADT